jgi:predicted nucleotide-binding protein (sugar kinase/HSP70/actin superfamily)
MGTDIVNFQQLGWSAEEIMAGLAKVLPKNIWLYVVQEPNLQKFGTNFILQGGTQHNLAAVKSQYDFISEKVPGANITVHDYCGESGAIGAALDAIRVVKQREGKSEYLGLEATQELTFSAKRDESTRCHFCKNKCLRTFIDTETSAGSRRFIIATCEKGTVENVDDMKGIKAEIQQIKKANPNFVEVAAKAAFRSFNPQKVYEADEGWLGKFNEWLVGRGRLEEDTAAEAVAKDVAASALPAANNNNGAAAGGNGAKPKRVPAKVQKLMDGGLSFEEATKKVEEARAAFNGNGNAPANGNGAKPKAKAAPPAVSEKASSPQNGAARAISDRKPQAKRASRPIPKTPVKKSAVPDSPIHPIVDRLSRGRLRSRREIMRYRETVKVGMPRVLNMYSTGPLWSAYMESLGVRPNQIAWSDYTEEQMWKEGSRRGSIDQCFPSKVAVAHIHNLVFKKRGIDVILFPAVINLPSWLDNALKHDACPTVQATPAVCKAAFTKESDIFAERGITFYDPPFHMNELSLFERECYNFFSKWLGVTPAENERAIEQGWEAMRKFHHDLQRVPAREVLEQLERENRVGVVLLGRPYHNDPGLNHEILEQVQKLGYPVFTIASLPIDGESLEPLFGEDVRRGDIVSGTDVTDVWKNCYSENSSQKVWAAKYVARHPNLVAIDLSSFKCGHDAPMYSVVESTVEYSGTPYFTFHDIDENKPTGSIKIRVETMDYFLKRYQEDMGRMNALEGDLQEKLEARKRELMAQLGLSMERAPEQEHVGEGLIQIQTSSSREAAVLA